MVFLKLSQGATANVQIMFAANRSRPQCTVPLTGSKRCCLIRSGIGRYAKDRRPKIRGKRKKFGNVDQFECFVGFSPYIILDKILHSVQANIS